MPLASKQRDHRYVPQKWVKSRQLERDSNAYACTLGQVRAMLRGCILPIANDNHDGEQGQKRRDIKPKHGFSRDAWP